MWSSEEYDKKINEFMRRAGQLKEETPDETEEQKQIEEEVEKIEEMIARETPLKPCPFCGGKAKIMHMGYPHWIYCEDCGARVHGRTVGEVEGVRASTKIWNSRIDFLPRAPHGKTLTNEEKEAIKEIREMCWGYDIPSPCCPEYREHHEQMQKIIGLCDSWLKKLEEGDAE